MNKLHLYSKCCCTWRGFSPTCEGDLGRGGPGDVGLSVWLGLAAGLLSGLSSSGGVGVLANRRGPESLSIKNDTQINIFDDSL